ncbi:MAG: membrane protein insertase YidC [Bacteroidales bacterium]
MDRNSLIGLILIAVIVVIYGIVNKPSQDEIEQAKRRRDSLQKAQQEQVDTTTEEPAAEKEEPAPIEDERTEELTDIEDASQLSELREQFGPFAESAEGDEDFIILENEKIKLKLFTKGGRPYSVEIKNHKTYTQEPLILFEGEENSFGFNFFANKRQISTNELYFVNESQQDSLYADNNPKTVTLRLHAGKDRYIDYIYTLAPEASMMDFKIRFVGMNEIIPDNLSTLNLDWEMYAPQLEKGRENENNYTTVGYKHYQDDVDDLRARGKDDASEEINTRLKWVSFKQQFFSSILVAENYFANSEVSFSKLDEEGKYLKKLDAELSIPYESQPEYEFPMKFFFGPNHYTTLKNYDLGFEELVPLGSAIFNWVTKLIIIPIFNWLDNFIQNYGIIILLLTIIIKIGLFPLTYRSYLSQGKMRVLKPEIDEINQKYPKKEDNMKKQKAVMDLYKKAGVNPMGGCIPLLLQFPFLIAMVRFFPSSFELRQESFLWADDLSSFDSILNLPFEIPFYGDHVSGFTLLMAVTLIFTTRINSSQMASSGQQMPGMKFFTTYLMPVMLLFIFNNFSAALSYYFFLSNGITLAQTMVMRMFVDDDKIHKKLKEKKKQKKTAKKSKWQERLEQAQKMREQKQNPKKRKR